MTYTDSRNLLGAAPSRLYDGVDKILAIVEIYVRISSMYAVVCVLSMMVLYAENDIQ